MKPSTLLPLVVGLGAGVVAVWMGLGAISKAKNANKAAPGVDVVVAVSEIPYGVAITEAMVAVKQFGSFPVDGGMAKKEEVVGRVTATKVVKSAPVLSNMLAAKETLPGAENQLPAGFRAEPVLVKSYTALDMAPGNRVDVFYQPGKATVLRGMERKSRRILQNVEVFSVGARRIGSEADTSGADPKKSARAPSGSSSDTVAVKLLVKAEDVTVLQEANINGDVQLSVRAAGDDTVYDVEDVTALTAEVKMEEAAPVEQEVPMGMVPLYHTVRVIDGQGHVQPVQFQVGETPAAGSGGGGGAKDGPKSGQKPQAEKQDDLGD